MPDPASIHVIHRTAQHQKLTWTRPGLPITLGPLDPAKYSVHCLDHSVPGTDQPCHPGAAAQSNWRLHYGRSAAKHRLPLRLRVLLAHMQPERIFVPDQYRLCQCYRRQVPKLRHTSHAEEQQVSDQHKWPTRWLRLVWSPSSLAAPDPAVSAWEKPLPKRPSVGTTGHLSTFIISCWASEFCFFMNCFFRASIFLQTLLECKGLLSDAGLPTKIRHHSSQLQM